MKKISIQMFAFALIVSCALLAAGCQQAEEAGDGAQDAMETVAEEAEEGMEAAGEMMEDGMEKMEDGMDAAGEAIEDGMEEVEDMMEGDDDDDGGH